MLIRKPLNHYELLFQCRPNEDGCVHELVTMNREDGETHCCQPQSKNNGDKEKQMNMKQNKQMSAKPRTVNPKEMKATPIVAKPKPILNPKDKNIKTQTKPIIAYPN